MGVYSFFRDFVFLMSLLLLRESFEMIFALVRLLLSTVLVDISWIKDCRSFFYQDKKLPEYASMMLLLLMAAARANNL